jgi:hypothetical protein
MLIAKVASEFFKNIHDLSDLELDIILRHLLSCHSSIAQISRLRKCSEN